MTIGLVLTVLFVLLKAFEKIDWSWWLVFLPLMIEVGLSFVLLVLFSILSALGVRSASKGTPGRRF